MKKLMLVLAAGVGMSVLAAESVTNVAADAESAVTEQTDATARTVGSSPLLATLAISMDVPPDKPDGDEQPGGDSPPDKPDGEGEGGEGGGGDTPPDKPDGEGEGGEGGGSSDSTVLTGAYQLDGGTAELDGSETGGTLESTTADQNVILAQSNATLTVTGYTLTKSGDTSSEDNSNFYALNAVVAAKTSAKIYIDGSVLNSNAEGANCLFASGSGSTIYAYDCGITSTKSSSRGLDATYEGTVIAAKLTVDTQKDHCAALATDRGNGYISVAGATLSTAGQGSPLVYSTGVIEANCVTGTATGAQIAGIEGLSTIRIRNSDLTGSGEKASEPVANGVIIYQSNSGDSTDGTATFEVSDSTLTSEISSGAMFYVTHSEAVITVENTDLDFDTADNCLLKVAGNDGSNGWGTAGENGGEVVFTAIGQTLAGSVSVDGISSLDMYLTNSTYTGTFVNDTTYSGDGDGIELFLSADSTWTVTADCTLKSLTVADGATIADGSGNTVTIVNSSGTKLVAGSGTLTVTVSTYSVGDVSVPNAITAFEIDRTAFETKYGTSEGEGGEEEGEGSGGATDHDGWVYYFKPHPPDNAIVKVKVDGAADYGTPDRDHKYCLDGYWDGGEDGVVVHLLYVTTEGYLFADGCKSNTWDVTVTNNAQEVYPPEDVVAIRAQARSGRTYYLTLKEAIASAGGGGKGGAKITLNDNVELSETLTVASEITLDLNTNTVTVGGALTEGFCFAADATVSNGTIVSSLAASDGETVLLRFTDCEAVLSDLTVTGDGALLYVDYGARVTVTNGCAFTCYSAAVVDCASGGTLTIAGDTRKDDGVVLAAPEGHYWEDGQLVQGTLTESIAAGAATDAYGDAQAATNAAAVINANKADCIEAPAGVEGTAKATYLTKVAATVTGDNCIAVDLTPVAEAEVQNAVDEAVTNEVVVASLVSTNAAATATIATTTPGLYYWIQGGAEVGAVTEAGPSKLSTDGGPVELTKPALDAAAGKAFFKVAAGVSAPQ